MPCALAMLNKFSFSGVFSCSMKPCISPIVPDLSQLCRHSHWPYALSLLSLVVSIFGSFFVISLPFTEYPLSADAHFLDSFALNFIIPTRAELLGQASMAGNLLWTFRRSHIWRLHSFPSAFSRGLSIPENSKACDLLQNKIITVTSLHKNLLASDNKRKGSPGHKGYAQHSTRNWEAARRNT